ncbi:MAG: acetate kinase, partial [Firmicutes bacterium]|nr:acetate kinase [Bacillota bacterium]
MRSFFYTLTESTPAPECIILMNGVDAIVFTAGIGENTPSLRTALCANL